METEINVLPTSYYEIKEPIPYLTEQYGMRLLVFHIAPNTPYVLAKEVNYYIKEKEDFFPRDIDGTIRVNKGAEYLKSCYFSFFLFPCNPVVMIPYETAIDFLQEMFNDGYARARPCPFNLKHFPDAAPHKKVNGITSPDSEEKTFLIAHEFVDKTPSVAKVPKEIDETFEPTAYEKSMISNDLTSSYPLRKKPRHEDAEPATSNQSGSEDAEEEAEFSMRLSPETLAMIFGTEIPIGGVKRRFVVIQQEDGTSMGCYMSMDEILALQLKNTRK